MGVTIRLLLVSFTILLTSCSDNTNSSDIEDNLKKVITDKQSMLSSNPNDYIENQSSAYKEILIKGDIGLTYLIKGLEASDQDGLKEWIMAKACEDILGDHSPVDEWATGKEWVEKYKASNK
jgi:hypothetical protein